MINSVLIDYLAFTVPNDSEEEIVGNAKVLHDHLVQFCNAHCAPLQPYIGGHMYTKGYLSFDGFRTYYGGPYTGKTLYVQISGEGCSMLQTFYAGGLYGFLMYLLCFSPKITRIDLAADEKVDEDSPESLEVCLTHERLFDAWINNLKVGKAEKMDLNAGRGPDGFTSFCLYVGKRKSDVFMRIYDKAAESKSSDFTHWMRCELELHRERAQQVFCYLTAMEDFSKEIVDLYTGICLEHCRFIERRASNISRSITASWWSDFLDGCTVNRYVLSVPTKVSTVYDVAAWIDRAVLGAWITVEKTFGSEFLRQLKSDYLDMDRLPAQKKRMIEEFRREEKAEADRNEESCTSVSPGSDDPGSEAPGQIRFSVL